MNVSSVASVSDDDLVVHAYVGRTWGRPRITSEEHLVHPLLRLLCNRRSMECITASERIRLGEAAASEDAAMLLRARIEIRERFAALVEFCVEHRETAAACAYRKRSFEIVKADAETPYYRVPETGTGSSTQPTP